MRCGQSGTGKGHSASTLVFLCQVGIVSPIFNAHLFVCPLIVCTNLQCRSVIHLKYLILVFGMSTVRVWTRAPTVLLEDDELLGAFAKLRKKAMSFVVSVRPSACDSPTVTGQTFLKFYI